ncbi:ABC transporter permease [Hutsoniella sourekii]
MRLTELIKSSFTTLKANGRRTFLTMIGIIIGISSVITILSIGNGFQKYSVETLTNDSQGRVSQWVMFYPKDGLKADAIKAFNPEDLGLAQEVQGVSDVEVANFPSFATQVAVLPVKRQDKSDYYNVAHSEEVPPYQMIVGRRLNQVDSDNRQRVTIINEDIAKEHFGSAEEALQQMLTIGDQPFTVVGVYAVDSKYANTGFISLTSERVMDIPSGTYDLLFGASDFKQYLKVFIEVGFDPRAVGQNVQKKLTEDGAGRSQGQYMFQDISQQMEGVQTTLQSATLLISAVAAISLFIAGVGVMNMMYISVAERTKEIGIRRSMGATQKSIQWQFLLEGIAITFLGGIIGYVFGIIISMVISQFLPFKSAFDIKTAMISVLISVFIGIVFSVMPARSAAKKNLVEILR